MPGPSIPNFFIAGAPKSGSTSLYHYLNQHPDVFMSPVKEPCYFSTDIRPQYYVPELRGLMQSQMEAVHNWLANGLQGDKPHGIVAHETDYLRLFSGVKQERAVGEASVSYLWSKAAAREISAFNPAAKIILILRNPTERAFSQYLYFLSDGHISHSCSEHIATCLKADGDLSLSHPFLQFGFYSQQLERMFDHVPQQQVRVWLYEDTLTNPAKFFREVLTFLEVDADFIPDASRRHLEVQVPKAIAVTQALQRRGVLRALRKCTPPAVRPFMKKLVYRRRGSIAMNSEDRRFLVQYYRDDVRRLERVIERDLSAWLQ